MLNNRSQAISLATNRPKFEVELPSAKISDFFGVNVFSDEKMKSYISSDAYKKLHKQIGSGQSITTDVADAVAAAMKSWAIDKGVTHFTHWFQPLTHGTAEKHDAFFDFDGSHVIEKFKGSALIQQEPDASSFPNGGLRATFEARGYTAWDPNSPAFIIDLSVGKTLCIPTIFVSYTGEALDHKTPLLKSLSALDKAASAVCQYFDPNVSSVTVTLGPEQEYFVVDKALYYSRPDLMLSGRTLFGKAPAKHQQLSDHYFGSIPSRVRAFMVDMEIECLKLGIPLRTRHNEVAPAQFETAPTFEECNLAVDHNQLLMDVMEVVAERHDLKVLFHEKPFSGINGSGKHNNWSMSTNTGVNLLSPGSKPKENIQFLTFLVNVIKAVYDNSDLLRASITSAANDHRLGAHEAPPAIISIFLGAQLTEVLNAIESGSEVTDSKNMLMHFGIDKLPEILLDNTDRNRTSPFAFTGNKFEFRAVGGSGTCSTPMMVLNAVVANQLVAFKDTIDGLIAGGTDKEVAIMNTLKEYIAQSKAVCFEGNGYSEEWLAEATKRGLPNLKTTPQALKSYVTPKALSLFSKMNILAEHEMKARNEVYYEQYIITLGIELDLIEEIASNMILPAAVDYSSKVITLAENLGKSGLKKESEAYLKTVSKISGLVADITEKLEAMNAERAAADELGSMEEQAFAYCDKVRPYQKLIRKSVDELELHVDDKLWPLPKYRELLFLR